MTTSPSRDTWRETRLLRSSARRQAANSRRNWGKREKDTGVVLAEVRVSHALAAQWSSASSAGCHGTMGRDARARPRVELRPVRRINRFCDTLVGKGCVGARSAGSGWRRARAATRCCAAAGPPSAGDAAAMSTATRAARACATCRRCRTRKEMRWSRPAMVARTRRE